MYQMHLSGDVTRNCRHIPKFLDEIRHFLSPTFIDVFTPMREHSDKRIDAEGVDPSAKEIADAWLSHVEMLRHRFCVRLACRIRSVRTITRAERHKDFRLPQVGKSHERAGRGRAGLEIRAVSIGASSAATIQGLTSLLFTRNALENKNETPDRRIASWRWCLSV